MARCITNSHWEVYQGFRGNSACATCVSWAKSQFSMWLEYSPWCCYLVLSVLMYLVFVLGLFYVTKIVIGIFFGGGTLEPGCWKSCFFSNGHGTTVESAWKSFFLSQQNGFLHSVSPDPTHGWKMIFSSRPRSVVGWMKLAPCGSY